MTHSSSKPETLVVSGVVRWLIVASVMLAAVIEVLDITIVNVALTHMMGALGATSDQVTWVLTSYIVSSAIVMPLVGFLVDRVGRKRLLLVSIFGFLVSSMLCGMAGSLTQMVFFRVMQGLFGASLIPLSQYILIDTFSAEERGKALAIWGIGIMVGPILGPTLGGYIIDLWDWRWIFYINIPVCVIAFLLAAQVIQETPIKDRPTDWVGLFWMVLGVGCLQMFLDRGQTEDWFQSNFIIICMLLSSFSLIIFISRGLKRKKNNLINLSLFGDANFTRATIILIVFAMGVFGLIALQPLMMQELMNYSAEKAGLVMAPRGFSSAIAMVVVAKLATKLDPRIFIATGLCILSYTSFLMSGFNLQTSMEVMSWTSLIQGFGVGFFFVPISMVAFSTLAPSLQAEASGLFNFGRSLGVSIGISLVSAYGARLTQANWNYIISRLTPENPYLQNWLNLHGLSLQDPVTLAYFTAQVGRQASMLAFVNVYFIIGVAFIVLLPLVFFLKKPKGVIHVPIGE